MVNVGEVYADSWKFDSQDRWEDVARCLDYVVKVDIVKAKGKEFKTLSANAKDGSNRGMFFCWKFENEPVKGFLIDRPMCGCGHSHE
jgi:hypothetical protein